MAVASLLLNAASMKNIRTQTLKTLNVVLVTLFAGAALASAAPAGPNRIHYKVDEVMTASGVDSDATGRVQAFAKKQGNANVQRLRVTAQNLDPQTSYTLVAQVGESEDFVVVTTFTTSASGSGKVIYFQRANKDVLPEVIDPLTDVRTLAIVNANSEIVLSIDLHASPSMQFELASVFNNTGSDPDAIGCVAIACQYGSVQFRLFAAGKSSEYSFCVNDAEVATYSAEWGGRISVGALPNGAPSPLLFKKLDLRNVSKEVILESDVRK